MGREFPTNRYLIASLTRWQNHFEEFECETNCMWDICYNAEHQIWWFSADYNNLFYKFRMLNDVLKHFCHNLLPLLDWVSELNRKTTWKLDLRRFDHVLFKLQSMALNSVVSPIRLFRMPTPPHANYFAFIHNWWIKNLLHCNLFHNRISFTNPCY